MARDGKFGTFSGVFTPSVLTILGVIMYLRLPWVVGNAGLYVGLGVILAAHVVSIATGLSVSSIATDKKVGGGGPYYIISRSFGLPIGGAIGMALFLGLSFSASLYIVGFSQSLLSAIGVAPTANAIRVCGSITIVVITAITFISTSLAIKSQFFILALIAASLLSVFLGSPSATTPHLSAASGSPSFAVLFGIFFPAVTGFTAGVNMSGDLSDPKGSIPRGTMIAIATGFLVYAGLAVFLTLRVDPAALRDDPEVLQHMALWGPAVIAGIWGATLSSAMGSILGAPRILQAMSADRITPKLFAKGVGPTSEPRNALILAFAIGEGGILIAELDLIARVVSMVFLALYTAINVTCAIESWASPDFRPRFRIPKLVSIVGAVTSILLMIQLDLIAMLGATALMLGLFGYLQRRQLTLEAGDTWEGVWSTLVRTGLQRLHRTAGEQRNWRPNVLLFDEADHAKHGPIREFATTLASGNGMVTDFALARSRGGPAATSAAVEHVGVFDRRIVTATPLETVASICQFHGFSGVPPNTVLLPWRQHGAEPDAFLRALRAAGDQDLNILLFEEPRAGTRKSPRQVDVWWSAEAGNLALSVALVRFITRAPEWDHATINVLLVGEEVDEDEVLRARTLRYLDETRVDAKVRAVHRRKGEGLHDVVCAQSADADLVLFGLPDDLATADRATLDRLDRIAGLPGGVVFLRAGGGFADVLQVTRRAPRRDRTPLPGASGELPQAAAPVTLPLPPLPELAATVTAIHEHQRALVDRLHDRGLGPAYEGYLELCETARALVERRAAALIEASAEKNPAKRRKLVNRATAAFLLDGDAALAEIDDDGAAGATATATRLTEDLRELSRDGAALPAGVPAIVRVVRPRAEFRADPDDDRALRRWKRDRRWNNFWRRRIPVAIDVGALARRGHDRVVCDAVGRGLTRFRADAHEIAVEVGKVLATAEWRAHAQLSRVGVDDAAALIERVERTRDAARGRLDELHAHLTARIAEQRADLDDAIAGEARQLCADLTRIDAPVAARAVARRAKADAATLLALPDQPEAWRLRQVALVKRSRLAGRLARFRDRLTVTTARCLEEIVGSVHASGLRACQDLREALVARAAGSDAPPPEVKEELPYDAAPVVARLARSAAALTGELPETEALITDEAAAALLRGDGGLETSAVPVRSAVQAMVETDLITRLQVEAQKFADADARAWAVARDIALLAAALPSQREDDDDDTAEVAPAERRDDNLERLDAQLAHLARAEDDFVAAVFDGLEAIATASGLDGLCASLDALGGRSGERDRPSRLRAIARRGVASVRDLAARAVYRRSAGVVYAQRTRAERERTASHAIRDLATRSAATPAVLAALPLYYRNLFTGQININEAFFVGRAAQVAEGVEVVRGQRGGGPRTVLISGDRAAGKTTLCQQIASGAGGAVHWVTAPPGGSCSPGALRAAFEGAVGARGTPMQVAARLPAGTVIVIDDLDLWWERRPGGLEAIEELLDVVATTGDRVGFVLGGGTHAVRLIDALRPLTRVAYLQVGCAPLTARQLDQVVMARHGSTGLRLKVGQRVGDAIGPWSRARLFDAHFDYSHGNVGYALRAWVAHVDALADEVLAVRTPAPLDWDALDDLRPELVAVLLELLLHKQVTADKLARVTGRPIGDLRDVLAELVGVGLATQNRRRVVQLNPFVHVPVVDWLRRRELT